MTRGPLLVTVDALIYGRRLPKNIIENRSVLESFLKTRKGFVTTNQEGFVSIDKIGNAVKIVDRMEFSRANFTAAKDWG